MFNISLRIKSIIIAIYLFIAGIAYGDAPVKMDFECTVPSGVYEYEAGDTVELEFTVKNTGRPFKAVASPLTISIYRVENGKAVSLYEPSTLPEPEWPEELIKSDYFSKERIQYIVSENAPKGEYIVSVSQFGYGEKFEGLITVK